MVLHQYHLKLEIELKSKITAYEKGKSVQLLQRDSRTLEAAMKRAPHHKVEKANKTLIYYFVVRGFGGKDYKCKSSGNWEESLPEHLETRMQSLYQSQSQ